MLIFINMTPTLLSKLPKVGDFFIKNNNKELVVKSFPVVTINYGIGGKIIEKTYRLNRIDLKEISSADPGYKDYFLNLIKFGKKEILK